MNIKRIVETYFNEEKGFFKHKNLAIQLLKQTIRFLDEFSINYFLISGTLLGYVRHDKDFIPWDDDIDLIVDVEILKKLPRIRDKYKYQLSFFEHGFMIKCCFRDGVLNLNNMKKWRNNDDPYNWPFIDLFFFEYSEDRSKIVFFEKEWSTDAFFPPKKDTFVTIENVCIPTDPHYFLEKNYGKDYMTKIVSSNWNHKIESANVGKSCVITFDEYKKISPIFKNHKKLF